jgi:hypothetical protein
MQPLPGGPMPDKSDEPIIFGETPGRENLFDLKGRAYIGHLEYADNVWYGFYWDGANEVPIGFFSERLLALTSVQETYTIISQEVPPPPPAGTYTFRQSPLAVNSNSGAIISKAFDYATLTHSLLIAWATTDSPVGTHTFSSTNGPTWGRIGPYLHAPSGQYISIGYCLDAPTVSGVTTVACTFGGASYWKGLIIGEFKTANGVASLVDGNTAGSTMAGPNITDSALTNAIHSLVVSACIATGQPTTVSPGSGFTLLQRDVLDLAAVEYKLDGAALQVCTHTLDNNHSAAVLSAAFKSS